MPVFKVWNQLRTAKKCIVASSIKEVKEKGKAKLGIASKVYVVLEEDGTSVDEDEVLLEFAGHTLILLQDGEIWEPVSSTMPCGDNRSSLHQDVQLVESTHKPPSPQHQSKDNPVSCTTSNIQLTRIPKDIPLPDFSTFVQQNLKQGTPHVVWGKLIAESANFYQVTGVLDSSSSYQAVGMKMYSIYPCIGMEGTKPWSLFTSNLSQHVRHLRWRAKKRSQPSSSQGSSLRSNPMVSPKRRRFDEKPLDPLPDDEFEMHMKEVLKEWKKPTANRSESHIKVLMQETHTNRQMWIKNLPDSSILPIFDKMPCFVDGTYLLYDFRLLLGKNVYSGLTISMETFLVAVESIMGDKEEGSARMLHCMLFIEKKTCFEKGKGKKTSSVVIIKEDIADADIDSELVTPLRAAPHIVVFRSDDTIKGTFIVGDSISIDCQSTNVSVAVLMLLAAYYVFDLEYPRIYSQFLGILQTHFLKTIPYDGQKSKNYCVFSTQLRNKIREAEKEVTQTV